MKCGYCGARVRYRARVCPVCLHLLANDVKARRIAVRSLAAVLACLFFVGAGILIGVCFF